MKIISNDALDYSLFIDIETFHRMKIKYFTDSAYFGLVCSKLKCFMMLTNI